VRLADPRRAIVGTQADLAGIQVDGYHRVCTVQERSP
jgi:hypothetical protein